MTFALRLILILSIAAIPAFAGAVRVFSGVALASLPKGDDLSSGATPLGFAGNFLGRPITSVYINTNGNITFDAPNPEYPGAPGDNLAGGVIPPMSSRVQPVVNGFLADIDTSAPAVGAITYGAATLFGRPAFVVNYLNIAGFSFSAAHFDSRRSTFQIVLVGREDTGAGNFDIELNYDRVEWETADSNGGTDGFGEYAALAGYSNGRGLAGNIHELPGSGVPASNTNPGVLSLPTGNQNSGVAGRYLFAIRNRPAAGVAAAP